MEPSAVLAMRTRYGHHVSHRDETMGKERDKDEGKESSAAADIDITVKQQQGKGWGWRPQNIFEVQRLLKQTFLRVSFESGYTQLQMRERRRCTRGEE